MFAISYVPECGVFVQYPTTSPVQAVQTQNVFPDVPTGILESAFEETLFNLIFFLKVKF
jgi:hypothetical protein